MEKTKLDIEEQKLRIEILRSQTGQIFQNQMDRMFRGRAPKQPEAKPFPEYLLHEKRENLAIELKKTFRNKKGLDIRYMVEALKNEGIIVISDRERMALYKAMKDYFGWNIATYNGIFKEKEPDKKNIENAQQIVNIVLNSIK